MGLGLVKLMGRHAGFIAASATLASREVDLVLVPEVPFELNAVTKWLGTRLRERGEAVVVVAEGAGQDHLPASDGADASGNLHLQDIGLFLKNRFESAFQELGADVKYIDPSYMIRAAPATPADAIYCGRLAENAVHAAMGGKTGLMMGLWANRLVHIPLAVVNRSKKHINLDGPLWRSVLEATGQPPVFSRVAAK